MSRTLHRSTLLLGTAGILLAASSNPASAQGARCNVIGTWELVSISLDGKAAHFDPERKIVTRTHFMWIGQAEHRDTLPLLTATDSLRVNRLSGGSGTYTLAGSSYTEHIDMFVTPSYVGNDFKAKCRTTATKWIHEYGSDQPDDATHGKPIHYIEVWRRVQ